MPLKFWDVAFLAATYLINRTPSKVIDYQTPLDRLYKIKLNYSSLRIFGCACWPNLRPYNPRKLAFRSKECVFLGYSNLHKGFKCLDISTGRIYISRDVIFDENVFPFSKLHENAGARLRSEILLLPPSLISSNGVANIELPMTNSSPDVFESEITNQSTAVHEIQEEGQSGDDQSRNQQMAQPAVDSPENQCQSLAPIVPGATAEQESPSEGPTGSPQVRAQQTASSPGSSDDPANTDPAAHLDQGGCQSQR
jgi:hypothetical protein